MNLKKITLNKTFYKSIDQVDFYIPEGVSFARTSPVYCHKDGQVDMITIIECSEQDEENLNNVNKWLSFERIDKYLIIKLLSVDDSEDIPRCSIKELNNKYDLSEYFLVELDPDYRLVYIGKIKGIDNSENILIDLVEVYGHSYSEKFHKTINFNYSLPMDRLQSYSSHYSNKIIKSKKAKTIFYTIVSRYLKDTGIEWTNEYVDENLDIEYIHRLAKDGIKQIGISGNTNTSDYIENFEKLKKTVELINNWFNV